MAFLRDLVGSFRKRDIGEYPYDAVVEVRHDDYKQFQPFERSDSLVLYGIPEQSKYEVILQKASFNRGVEVDFSLSRFFSEHDALSFFHQMKDKLPYLCSNHPEIVNQNNLKEITHFVKSNPHQSLVHICAYFGFLDILKTLLAKDPSLVNEADTQSHVVPLHLAIKNSKLPIIVYLLSLNCDLTRVDSRGWNIFHYAATTSREIISILCSAPFFSSSPEASSPTSTTNPIQNMNQNDTTSSTLSQRLPSSLNERKIALIRLINQRNHDKNCPLYLACAADKPECVKELLKNGADGDGASLETIISERDIDQSFEHVLEQLDPKVMHLGGSALHWAKSQQCLEALLDMGLNINGRNFQGETTLHCMVSKKNLSCIVTLLSHGADVSAKGPNGETPLHLAVRTGDPTIVQALVVFGSDLNNCNNSGETSRHIAATAKRTPNQDLILYILDTVGARRCKKQQNLSCTDGCAMNANFNGIPPENSPLGRIVSIYDNCYRDVLELALQKKRVEHDKIDMGDQSSRNSVRLLCLDGGGVKGLILVQMLSFIEQMTNRHICHLFNWFAGTSTGALLSIALALGNSASQCRQIYFRLKDKVFAGSRPYDSEPLEKFLQKEFGQNTRLCDVRDLKLMVTATYSDRFPPDLQLFRNYSSADEILRSKEEDSHEPQRPGTPNDLPLWMVARCSGAAPTYFKPCGQYLDGGLMSNNPTLDALTEISKLNAAFAHIGEPEKSYSIDLLVSCGCGLIPIRSISVVEVYRPDSFVNVARMALTASALGELLIEQATQAEGQVVERAKAWCHGIKVPYFRLNPPISEQIPLDEINNARLINMLWETTVYMYNRKKELEELALLFDQ